MGRDVQCGLGGGVFSGDPLYLWPYLPPHALAYAWLPSHNEAPVLLQLVWLRGSASFDDAVVQWGIVLPHEQQVVRRTRPCEAFREQQVPILSYLDLIGSDGGHGIKELLVGLLNGTKHCGG